MTEKRFAVCRDFDGKMGVPVTYYDTFDEAKLDIFQSSHAPGVNWSIYDFFRNERVYDFNAEQQAANGIGYQLDLLANYIMAEIPGEPSQSEGAGDTAIRLLKQYRADNTRLQAWVNDLQSGMYVNCVYCGHRYGPGETTPVTMADALKAHIEQCPEHPMSKLKAENIQLRAEKETLMKWAGRHTGNS